MQASAKSEVSKVCDPNIWRLSCSRSRDRPVQNAVRSRHAMGCLLSFQDAWLCRPGWTCVFGVDIGRLIRESAIVASCCLPKRSVPRRLRGRSFWQMQRQTGRPLILWCSKDWRNNYWILLVDILCIIRSNFPILQAGSEVASLKWRPRKRQDCPFFGLKQWCWGNESELPIIV